MALQKLDAAIGNDVFSVNVTSPLTITAGPNPIIGITQASATVNGYLTSTDWNIFNNKQNAVTLTTTGSSGPATFNGTSGALNIPDYSGAFSGFVPITRTLTINGVSQDLSADRTWTIDTLYTANGVLTSDRTVNSGGFSLTLNPNTNLAGSLFGNTLRTRNSFSGSYTQNGTVFANVSEVFSGTSSAGNTLYMGQSNIEVTGGSSNVQTQGIDIEQHIKLSGASSRILANNYIIQYRGYNGDISTNANNFMTGLYIITGHAKYDTTTNIVTGNAFGYRSLVDNYGGSITNAAGYDSNLQASPFSAAKSSTITNYYAFRSTGAVGAASGPTATITNYYALFLNTLTVNTTGTITNRWGIYAPDNAMKHYLNGTVLIGSATDSALAKLQVTGAIQQSSVISSMLKANSNGVLVNAVANTDYLPVNNPVATGQFQLLGSGITTYAPYINTLGAFASDINDYQELYIQNLNAGSDASADILAYNDLSTTDAYYIDMGINSSNYSSVDFPIFPANSGYVFTAGGSGLQPSHLYLGTVTPNSDVVLFAGGSNPSDIVLTVTGATKNVIIGTGLASDTGEKVQIDGNVKMTNGDLRITGGGAYADSDMLGDPHQLTTKEYVDNQVSAGIHVHEPVRVESSFAFTATYTQGGTTPTITDITLSSVLKSVGHGLSVDDMIVFNTTSNGITAGISYFVYQVLSPDTFTISETIAGPAINTLTNGTGLTLTSRANSGVGATLTNAGAQVALVIDGVSVVATDRVLIYNQAVGYWNGVYVVNDPGSPTTNWVLERAPDANKYGYQSPTALGGGDYFYVLEGLTGIGESYIITNVADFIIGTDTITFTLFSASPAYTGIAPISVVGQNIQLSGIVDALHGGTGTGSVAVGDLLYGSATDTWNKLPLGVAYKSLIVNGSGTNVEWNALPLNQSAAVSGQLNVANGGTGAATLTGILIGNGTSAFTDITGTALQLLRRNSTNTAYEFFTPSYITLAALSANLPLLYNNATGVFSIQVANTSQDGYLSSTDWNTFNSKQAQINGTGFVKASGTTISYDNSTYYLASNPNAYIPLTALSAGTGINYNNTTGVITNSAPDQVVTLTQGGTTVITGTYPNFTISSSDQYVGTVTSVSGTGTVSGLTLSGTVTSSGSLTLGGSLTLTSGQITTGLGYTPYNATNPSGFLNYNIYTANSSLSGNRTVTGGGNFLKFDDVNGIQVVSTGRTNEVMKLTSTEPYLLIAAAGASNSASLFLSPSTSAQNATIQNRTGGGLEFYTGATPSVYMVLQSTGQLKLNAYTSTSSFTGTAAGYLAFDASGNILTISGGGGSGTVTSIATSGPITGGTITTSGTIGITQATTSTDGYLSSTDWNTFNGKVNYNIYTSDGTLAGNRTVLTTSGYTLTLNPKTTINPTIAGNTSASSDGFNTVTAISYAAGFSSGSLGYTYSTNDNYFNQSFEGSATFASPNVNASIIGLSSINFINVGGLVTMTQAPGGIRAMGAAIFQNQYIGTNSGTVTHLAGIQILGNYRNGGTGTLTVTNAYGLLINDLNEYGVGFTQTNRWGIYQAGTSDNNYFGGQVLIGSTAAAGDLLNLGIGTTTVAPLNFASTGSSALKTSAALGDMEVDANGQLYYTHNNLNRGVVSSEQFLIQSGTYTLGNNTTLQKAFNASTNGALTVKGTTTYFFECYLIITAMSATSGNMGFSVLGTGNATVTSVSWFAHGLDATTQTTAAGIGGVSSTAAGLTGNIITAGTGTAAHVFIKGVIRINAAGTIIPSVQQTTASAAIVGANSWFRIWPVGTNTVTTVGNWS